MTDETQHDDLRTIYAWHFSDGTLSYGDARPIIPGLALTCEPEDISLCGFGFHANLDIIDVLQYAPGAVLSYVECGGKIVQDDDKLVCSQRRHLAVVDITNTLHEFGCWCAEQALALIDNPDPRSLAAIAAKRKWMQGEISDEELAYAAYAAYAADVPDAAYAVVHAAAHMARVTSAAYAAKVAFYAASAASAAYAAHSAAYAAHSTAHAAHAAAHAVQSKQLLEMVLSLPEFA